MGCLAQTPPNKGEGDISLPTMLPGEKKKEIAVKTYPRLCYEGRIGQKFLLDDSYEVDEPNTLIVADVVLCLLTLLLCPDGVSRAVLNWKWERERSISLRVW